MIFDSEQGWATDINYLISIEHLTSHLSDKHGLKIRDISLPYSDPTGYRYLVFSTLDAREQFYKSFVEMKNQKL